MQRMLYRRGDMPLQKYLASPLRDDGSTAEGMPGDCYRTAIAGALGVPRDSVPHFVSLAGDEWFWEAQRWFREQYRVSMYTWGVDAWRENEPAPLYPGDSPWIVVSGPSPRGPWWHSCVANRNLEIVHDPHPLGTGLKSVEAVDVLMETDWNPPHRKELLSRKMT